MWKTLLKAIGERESQLEHSRTRGHVSAQVDSSAQLDPRVAMLEQCRQRVLREFQTIDSMPTDGYLRLPIVLPLRAGSVNLGVSAVPSASLAPSDAMEVREPRAADVLGLPPLRAGGIEVVDTHVTQSPLPGPASYFAPLASAGSRGTSAASLALRKCFEALRAHRIGSSALAEEAVVATIKDLFPHLGIIRVQASTFSKVREAVELRLFGYPPGGVSVRRRATQVCTYHKKVNNLLIRHAQDAGQAEWSHEIGFALLMT